MAYSPLLWNFLQPPIFSCGPKPALFLLCKWESPSVRGRGGSWLHTTTWSTRGSSSSACLYIWRAQSMHNLFSFFANMTLICLWQQSICECQVLIWFSPIEIRSPTTKDEITSHKYILFCKPVMPFCLKASLVRSYWHLCNIFTFYIAWLRQKEGIKLILILRTILGS